MGGDLPPAVLPSFMLGWGSSQARDALPKGKRKLGIRKFYSLPPATIIPSPRIASLKILLFRMFCLTNNVTQR
jgi:hypothetical protein